MDHSRRNKAPLLCLSTCVLSVFALLLSTTDATTTTNTLLCPDLPNKADCYIQVDQLEEGGDRPLDLWSMSIPRRYLSGPGSHPPRCTSKCGKCTPCKPVHVPVPPGAREPAEYYPEAWRCKCGNRLYMP